MKAVIRNLYSNVPGSDLYRGDHGQSFLIDVDDRIVMFDTGAHGEILLHNMREMSLDPDRVDALVLSHGHNDHTAGLPALLAARSCGRLLPVYAHPGVTEEKILKLGPFKRREGFPELSNAQKSALDFRLDTEPVELTSHLKISGEIRNREQREGTEPLSTYWENRRLVTDPMADDISLYLLTSRGLVIITGCAHAGILNICEQAKALTRDRIRAIVGGTRMVRYGKAEVRVAAEKLAAEFDNPVLYLNHCTQELPSRLIRKTPAIAMLTDALGSEQVRPMNVGDVLEFECA